MKLYTIVLFYLFLASSTYSQEILQNKTNTAYEELLQAIASKDTLVTEVYKAYKCSPDFKGNISFYYKEKELRLIKHSYKQDFYSDWNIEYYYIENNTLRLQTVFTEIIHLNTYSSQSSQRSSAGMEKVLELVERRMFFESNTICYERRHGEKLSEWNQEYFDTLPFKKSNSTERIDDITYNYRLLRKAEKRMNSYRNKPACIFHVW